MMNLIEGLSFASVDQHALPARIDGFFKEYKKNWMDSFKKRLVQYDPQKLKSALQIIMKQGRIHGYHSRVRVGRSSAGEGH